MAFQIKKERGFTYIDEGEGDVLLLLHGLFGALSNWDRVIADFSPTHRVVIPVMPIYEMPIKEAGIGGLVDFIQEFVAFKQLTDLTLLGNSLGGHVALVYTLNNPNNVRRLVLTGSSGLFENAMGGSFPKRGSYDYIKERVAYTFYDPATATKELVDEVFDITKSIPKCMRIVAIAKSAQRHNVSKDIQRIQVPTLLVWGLNDTITPPMVAHDFNRLIPGSELWFVDKCGHAPMMEHPDRFNQILSHFLEVTQVV
ncbi:Pimeloyl-ACP methyl ester carboxylesterase [Catalinimonas alkaloidigena]|uniref:Pimeloyl-ACP methyl ester carboxylesterase n=1 Tax=Catalinimonas alkaloidigena TaxID=1075417 RepID=A0A1G9DUI0_9BACT|nr:alpha/beta hydrolase [Catalinimonas alkaloidigena]SDK67524.1 Pimeloyl-ACP methyl ester carboxylesterase [Catalinimonas alkaloidigena]